MSPTSERRSSGIGHAPPMRPSPRGSRAAPTPPARPARSGSQSAPEVRPNGTGAQGRDGGRKSRAGREGGREVRPLLRVAALPGPPTRWRGGARCEWRVVWRRDAGQRAGGWRVGSLRGEEGSCRVPVAFLTRDHFRVPALLLRFPRFLRFGLFPLLFPSILLLGASRVSLPCRSRTPFLPLPPPLVCSPPPLLPARVPLCCGIRAPLALRRPRPPLPLPRVAT